MQGEGAPAAGWPPTDWPPRGWGFHNPVAVRFGPGVRAGLLDYLTGPDLGAGVLLVTTRGGRARLAADGVLAPALRAARVAWIDEVAPNPGLHEVERQARQAADAFDGPPRLVAAVGGGSVLDTAKALAVRLAERESRDLPALVAADSASLPPPVPVVALPTTAGTGSEVTPFATLWDKDAGRKLSLAGAKLFPAQALVDPELTVGLPRAITAATGLDAVNQALESAWNRNATPITLAWAGRALSLGLAALPALLEAPSPEAEPGLRARMAEASLLAGLCISQTRTALCHAMSYPLTARFGVPHGVACAFTMQAVLALNRKADDGRLHALAQAAGCADLAGLAAALDALLARAGVAPRVRAQLGSLDALTALAPEMWTPGRTENTLHPVTESILVDLLARSWSQDRARAEHALGDPA